MQFIEMSGKVLKQIVGDDELQAHELEQIGVTDESMIRINRQGDIEIRRHDTWDVVGGFFGDFEHRVQREAGLGWADCGRRACGVVDA